MPEGDRKHQWVVRLDKAGFAVSTGSACTTGKEEPSHVLSAMGYKSMHAVRAVRFSAGWETNEADWETLVKGVAKVHGEMHAAKA
jgi:cysteine desulfurase